MVSTIGDQVIIDQEHVIWLEQDLYHRIGTVIDQSDDGKSQVAFVADSACGQTAKIVNLPTHCFVRDKTAAQSYNGLMELSKTLLGALHASLDLLTPGSLAHTKRKEALQAIDNDMGLAMDCPHGCCFARACRTVHTALIKPNNEVAPPYSP